MRHTRGSRVMWAGCRVAVVVSKEGLSYVG